VHADIRLAIRALMATAAVLVVAALLASCVPASRDADRSGGIDARGMTRIIEPEAL
jgi:hypothetical protein